MKVPQPKTDDDEQDLEAGKKIGVKDIRTKRQFFSKKVKGETMKKKAFTVKRKSVKL